MEKWDWNYLNFIVILSIDNEEKKYIIWGYNTPLVSFIIWKEEWYTFGLVIWKTILNWEVLEVGRITNL